MIWSPPLLLLVGGLKGSLTGRRSGGQAARYPGGAEVRGGENLREGTTPPCTPIDMD